MLLSSLEVLDFDALFESDDLSEDQALSVFSQLDIDLDEFFTASESLEQLQKVRNTLALAEDSDSGLRDFLSPQLTRLGIDTSSNVSVISDIDEVVALNGDPSNEDLVDIATVAVMAIAFAAYVFTNRDTIEKYMNGKFKESAEGGKISCLPAKDLKAEFEKSINVVKSITGKFEKLEVSDIKDIASTVKEFGCTFDEKKNKFGKPKKISAQSMSGDEGGWNVDALKDIYSIIKGLDEQIKTLKTSHKKVKAMKGVKVPKEVSVVVKQALRIAGSEYKKNASLFLNVLRKWSEV